MYRGFNISGISVDTFSGLNFKDRSEIHEGLASCGMRIGLRYKNSIEGAIKAIERNGRVEFSGNEIEGLCFPHLDFDVFISHSHNDERTAIELAGFLKCWCGLDAFVDSCAWNFRDEIIGRLINLISRGAEPSVELCSSVVSHVDCMLNKALISMIDECECLFFLNTPNSIPSTKLGSVTYSPWIYTELEASRVIRKRKSDRRPGIIKEAFSLDESPYVITYDVRLDHLFTLAPEKVVSWGHDVWNRNRLGFAALDKLYDLFPIEGEVSQ